MPALDSIIPDDEDVLEEENIVKRQAMQGEVDSNVAVQLHGLVKIFPGTTKMGCCKCQSKSPFHALKVFYPLVYEKLTLAVFSVQTEVISREKKLHFTRSDRSQAWNLV